MRKSAPENILQVDADDRAQAAASPRQREDLCEIADDDGDGLKRRSCSLTEILKKGKRRFGLTAKEAEQAGAKRRKRTNEVWILEGGRSIGVASA